MVVEHADEPVHRHAHEALFVEGLLFKTPEEALRGRVVWTASLRTHRTRQAVALADADPFRPPVAAAAVEMDDRPLSVLERGARVGEHAVAAVDDRRQVGLVCGDGELREVRDPQHVRTLGVESPVR